MESSTARYLATLSLLLSLPATADEVTLTPVADVTLYEDTLGEISNGAGSFFFVGTTDESPPKKRRAIIKFDLAAAIPAFATITDVSLTLTQSRTVGNAVTVELRRCLETWGEGGTDSLGMEGAGDPAVVGESTWIHRFYATANWNQSGGTFAAPSATLVVGTEGVYTFTATAGMIADLQSWLDDPASNHGWVMKVASELPRKTAKRFNSRSHVTGSTHPQLRVTFTPAPLFADGFESGDSSAWSQTTP